MKKPSDPRHQKRIKIIKELFALGFSSQKRNSLCPAPDGTGLCSFLLSQIKEEKAKKILNHLQKIDKLISRVAPLWPIEKINKIDLAILRLAVYELIIEKTEPIKVIIDEAVELAKEFGNEQSGPFVNGALGSIVKDEDFRKEN